MSDFSSLAKLFLQSYFSGVKEALSLRRFDDRQLFQVVVSNAARTRFRPYDAIVSSNTIRTCMRKCLVLNGLLFLGSILLFENLLRPLLASAMSAIANQAVSANAASTTAPGGSHTMLTAILTLAYYVRSRLACFSPLTALCKKVLWIFPWYVLSYVLNAGWYSKIAKRYFQLRTPPPSAAAKPSPSSDTPMLSSSNLSSSSTLLSSSSARRPGEDAKDESGYDSIVIDVIRCGTVAYWTRFTHHSRSNCARFCFVSLVRFS
jgi:hypothetical protein